MIYVNINKKMQRSSKLPFSLLPEGAYTLSLTKGDKSWKSQKIHTLGYRFIFGNHKHLAQKPRGFWFGYFFLEIFEKADMGIPMDFGCFESVSSKY
jgi:hypothetical protein